MDPNANLKEQRRLAKRMLDTTINDEPKGRFAFDAMRLAELAIALDEWLCNGGFKPSEWVRRPGT